MKYNKRKGRKSQEGRIDLSEEALDRMLHERKVLAKETLLDLCVQSGIIEMMKMFKEEVELLCGRRYKHQGQRQASRWGKTNGEVVLGGRKLGVVRQRVRDVGGEVELQSYHQFRDKDRLTERVMAQMLLGVSTRKYRDSLETGALDVVSSGGARSSISRNFIRGTGRRVKQWLSRSLSKLRLVALLIDGINFGDHTLVVALGVACNGEKHVLGICEGSTENSVVCQALIDNLLVRGLRIKNSILVVLDGARALCSVVRKTFGSNVVIQRCQYHKRQNVKGHLPKCMHSLVDRTMLQAYRSDNVSVACSILTRLEKTLETAYPGAARSLREGRDETLTVIALGLPLVLRQSFQTTNLIENSFSGVRRVSRNVKCWRNGRMVERWAAVGLMEVEKQFRRIRGYKQIPLLIAALENRGKKIDKSAVA